MANPLHNSMVADGSWSVPVEATYRLGDYSQALETPARQGAIHLRS